MVYDETSDKAPICNVLPMVTGNRPVDDGQLIFTEEEKEDFLSSEPLAAQYMKPLISAREYIHGKPRYCLWLIGVEPGDLRKMPHVRQRIEAVKAFRLASTAETTRKLADRASQFRDLNNPETYVLIPATSSENRQYIPMGFFGKNDIPSNSCLIIPDCTIYHFGILESSMHMAWMRYVCGRLEMRYRYSKDIVYNNFPWPQEADGKQKAAVEKAAQAVLDARAAFPKSNLAALYDPVTMPPELTKAHQTLDRAVEKAYGKEFTNDADRVSHLFYRYQTLTEGLIAKKTRRKNL